jgi:hypothetical protein
LEVYETDKSTWSKYKCEIRFRHAAWITDAVMYVFGGFEPLFPTVPTNDLAKIELGEMFLDNDAFLKIIVEHVIEIN